MRNCFSLFSLFLLTTLTYTTHAQQASGDAAADATSVETITDEDDTLAIQRRVLPRKADDTTAVSPEAPEGTQSEVVVEEDEPAVADSVQPEETAPVEQAKPAAPEDSVVAPSAKPLSPPARMVEEDSTAEELIVDEETDLLIVDDQEESLLEDVVEEPAVQTPAPLAGGEDTDTAGEESSARSDTTVSDQQQPVKSGAVKPITEEKPWNTPETVEVEPEKPAIIEDARSINFAKGLREYRSPKLAMLMSLAVPGLGQAYAKRYWRTALYGAVELAVIGVSVNYAVKGRDQRDEARGFADEHYRRKGADGKTGVRRFTEYYKAIENHVRQLKPDEDSMAYEIKRQYERFEGDYPKQVSEWMKTAMFYYDTTDMRRDAASGDSRFYEYIGDPKYVHGWDDAEPGLSDNADRLYSIDEDGEIQGKTYTYKYADPDRKWLLNAYDPVSGARIADMVGIYGYSLHQQQYNDMIHESNRLYKTSTKVLLVLLANHLVSAVDAFIAARAHNERLLGRQSLWEQIHLDQQVAFDKGGLTTELGVRVSF